MNSWLLVVVHALKVVHESEEHKIEGVISFKGVGKTTMGRYIQAEI